LTTQKTISRETDLSGQEYRWGFVTDVETELAPKGLNEDIVRLISEKKGEPEWLLEWRLKAFKYWESLNESEGEPDWAMIDYPGIDFQDIYYYAAPKGTEEAPKSLDDVDPEMLETFEKLGIPLQERAKLAGVAVDAVFDSVSVATTMEDKLAELGIIFCSFNEAVKKHPELVKKYLGSVVPHTDNFYAALNSAVFSDGSFAYIPPGVKCPIELMTYFRINTEGSGQFERTLIVPTRVPTFRTWKAALLLSGSLTNCMLLLLNLWHLMILRSNTRRSRTGSPAPKRVKVGSITSSRSVDGPTRMPRFPGLRLRPVLQSPGSTRV